MRKPASMFTPWQIDQLTSCIRQTLCVATEPTETFEQGSFSLFLWRMTSRKVHNDNDKTI